jgi:AraC-like DNA-binding protein
METFTTSGLPAAGRVAAWNDLYSSRMSRVEFTPGDQRKFDAELRIGQLGPVKFARLLVDRCSIERSSQHLAQSPRLYSFLLQVRGNSTFHHYGHEAALSEGDFVLCDTGLPHFFLTRDTSLTIMVRVFPDSLRQCLPSPERFCGRRLGRNVGFTSTAGAMVRSLAEHVETAQCGNHEERVAGHLLDMISLSYTTGFDCAATESTAVRQRRHEVVRHIEAHLRDSMLTPASVAAGLRLSPRYLRAVFSASGEKVSAYILQRRLDECARRIRDPAWRGHTLMDIAFDWGFKSAAHFTRTFREQYGMNPRAYRAHWVDQR